MKYTIHGPFEVRRQKTGLVDHGKEAKAVFWSEVKKIDEALPDACGCYLFAIRAGGGIKPWYVGLAAKQAFEKECFAPQKINIYNDVIAKGKGTPLLFLIAKRTPSDKFARPGKNGYKDIEYLETFMIGAVLEKNTDLMNIKKTNYLRKMCVPCLINSPKRKPTNSEKEFERVFV
ncbi:MAG: hypothetical protein HZC51_04570 [Nitrospirae bacterium]|nr:hypothetical protein [Nitrospirota bacterium]